MRIFSVILVTLLVVLSCQHDDNNIIERQIQFSFAKPATTQKNNPGGRTKGDTGESEVQKTIDATTIDPQGVIVTLKDNNGNVIVQEKQLTLYKFGDSFLSQPLTMKVSGGQYHLSEFFVTGANGSVIMATPREGSALAYLVADPLDIDFVITSNQITTVSPEVLAIDSTSNPGDFGYGQFGFNLVKTISTVFSSFVKGVANFELTTSHIKIQAVNDTLSTDTSSLWTYQTDLAVKANILTLKQAPYYRVTATKAGYATWKKNLPLTQGSAVEILFNATSGVAGDIYVGGLELLGSTYNPIYWKNGVATKVSSNGRVPVLNSMSVWGTDVYMTGQEEGTNNPFYWKNGQKVILPLTQGANQQFITKVVVNGNDVYALGLTGGYWKNGTFIPVSAADNSSNVSVLELEANGNDVSVAGLLDKKLDGVFQLWQDGVVTPLSLPSSVNPNSSSTSFVSIKIKNGHTYILGIVSYQGESKAVVWKDGVPSMLLSSTSSSTIPWNMAIADDGTIHVVGGQLGTPRPIYWRNGIETQLNIPAGAAVYYGVDVAGNSVVITGGYVNSSGPPTKPFYWKDGQMILMDYPDQNLAAEGLFISFVPR